MDTSPKPDTEVITQIGFLKRQLDQKKSLSFFKADGQMFTSELEKPQSADEEKLVSSSVNQRSQRFAIKVLDPHLKTRGD